jgi:hypothetical protein
MRLEDYTRPMSLLKWGSCKLRSDFTTTVVPLVLPSEGELKRKCSLTKTRWKTNLWTSTQFKFTAWRSRGFGYAPRLCCAQVNHSLYPTALSYSNKQFTCLFMSHAQPTSSSSSSSNFQFIIINALDKYKKRTNTDLIAHPLAAQLQSCDSPNAILAVLQQQAQELDRSRSSDERWSRWLDPTVNVIYALSSTVAAGVGLVRLRP